MAEQYPLLPGQVYNSPNNNVKPYVNIKPRPRPNRPNDPLLKSDNKNENNVINEERKKFFVKCREGNLKEIQKYIGLYPDFIYDRDDEDDDHTCLLLAGSAGNSAVVEYLIRKGADINAINKEHSNLLHVTAFAGNLELVRFLVDDKGFDINKQNITDATPLHYAVFWAKKDIVEFLINKGANLYLKDKLGDTPYQLSNSKRNKSSYDVVIEEMLKVAMDKSPPQGGSRKSQSRRQRKRKSRTRKVRR